MTIDSDKVKSFWMRRGKKTKDIDPSITNFEDNKDLKILKNNLEENKIFDYLELKKDYRVLDLGCGWGNWAFKFADKVKEIYAVDFCSDLIKAGKKECEKRKVNNINFFVSSVQDFKTDQKFDIIFLSGIVQYINDFEFEKLLDNISNISKNGTKIVLREPTGIIGRYEVNNKYSEALKDYYSATYRTREEFIDAFEKKGFKLIKDDDMYPEGSPLNKWPETRLRIYSFRRSGLVNGV